MAQKPSGYTSVNSKKHAKKGTWCFGASRPSIQGLWMSGLRKQAGNIAADSSHPPNNFSHLVRRTGGQNKQTQETAFFFQRAIMLVIT